MLREQGMRLSSSACDVAEQVLHGAGMAAAAHGDQASESWLASERFTVNLPPNFVNPFGIAATLSPFPVSHSSQSLPCRIR